MWLWFCVGFAAGLVREIVDIKSTRIAEQWDNHSRIKDVMDLQSFVQIRSHIWRLLREQHLGDDK